MKNFSWPGKSKDEFQDFSELFRTHGNTINDSEAVTVTRGLCIALAMIRLKKKHHTVHYSGLLRELTYINH